MKKQHKSLSVHDLDLESIIHGHSLFFDKLIELIPARFYLLTHDTEKPWFQGLSKAEKASVKQKSRENIKKARRDRLDPERSSSTTLDLLKESLENEKSDFQVDGGSDGEAAVKPVKPIIDKDRGDRSVTYEELRERLHKQIEELRSGLGGSDKVRNSIKNEKTEKRDSQQKKRKRDAKSEKTQDGDKGKN